MTPEELKTAREVCERVPQPQDWELILAARTTLPAALDFIEELLWDVFNNVTSVMKDGGKKGWICSNGLTDGRFAGDYLTALGKLEKHPDGLGKVQFYRPIEKEKPRG